MKKHVNLVVALMALCVSGIIGLQVYWNVQNYHAALKTFRRDADEAMKTAVDRELDLRQRAIVARLKGWMADTTLIRISTSINPRYGTTVFHVADAHPRFGDHKPISFGIAAFKERLTHITPAAKRMLITHFGDRLVLPDLKKGIVYYYTTLLGDSLELQYQRSRVDTPALKRLFRQELDVRDIHTGFVLGASSSAGSYHTRPANAHLRRPYQQTMVSASFGSPTLYFLDEMKWLLLSSLLLIGITIACFAYAVKTLFSQQQLAELKDDFINNMSHELNTPIAAIKITAESLKTFEHDEATRREYLEMIGYQATRLEEMTDRVLEHSRAGSSAEAHALICLDEVLSEAMISVSAQAHELGASIAFEPHQPSVPVRGDRAALLSLFTNLLDNALNYAHDAPNIRVSLHTAGKHALVRVADQGIGIPPAYRERVFDRFFRVPQGDTHDVKGYGLGLYTVMQVARQHGGTASVSANEPRGSVFSVKIPLAG